MHLIVGSDINQVDSQMDFSFLSLSGINTFGWLLEIHFSWFVSLYSIHILAGQELIGLPTTTMAPSILNYLFHLPLSPDCGSNPDSSNDLPLEDSAQTFQLQSSLAIPPPSVVFLLQCSRATNDSAIQTLDTNPESYTSYKLPPPTPQLQQGGRRGQR